MNVKWMGFVPLAFALVGCATLTDVNHDGQPEGEIVWPDLAKDVTFDNDRGTLGDMARIALIRDGATRDDVYQLIGRPQFHEGFHVREWDYLFHFQKESGAEFRCQYKLLFDGDYRVRHVYWKSPTGEEHCPPSQNITLSADALFRFNGGSLDDLLTDGRGELNDLSHTLRDEGIRSIEIYGYTDRLGTDVYNQALSAQRAETVKAYLVSKGIDGGIVSAKGKGEADPVVSCSDDASRAALIACLQPNRRVEVKVNR